MKKYSFIILLILGFTTLSAQPRRGDGPLHSGPKPIYVESHTVPQDSVSICFVSYKVPYSNLVFVKNDLNYNSGIEFRIEVTGKGGVLARESTHGKVTVGTYEETNLQDRYLEGIVSFTLSADEATVNPLVTLDNTDRQIPLRPFKVSKNHLAPVVVKSEDNCTGSIGYSLINFENSIPFGDENYKLFIPVYDAEIKKIKLKLIQEDIEIVNTELNRKIITQFDYKLCGSKIVIGENLKNITAGVFVLEKFSNLLKEGPVELILTSENDSTLYSGDLLVSWISKPLSLMNPKFAFELLEVIENEDKLDNIYDQADNDYEMAIDLFWKDYDPNKKTTFNQLMYEFYARADKAIRDFSSTGNRYGAVSDRGKVYIKYGEPAEVDRFYSDKNQITEVWKYLKPNTQFVFIDVTGLGNYKLVN